MGLLVHFFGPKLNKRLKLAQFKKFIAELHEAIARLEFEHYDYNSRGRISGINLALALLARCSVKIVDKYLDKVNWVL